MLPPSYCTAEGKDINRESDTNEKKDGNNEDCNVFSVIDAVHQEPTF